MSSGPGAEGTAARIPRGAGRPVRLAREDLARRLGLDPRAVKVVSVREVDWRDTSLGCPKPGMMYAQVITPGYRVVLEADGQAYEYHTDRGARVVAC
jgi:hypothetical protein